MSINFYYITNREIKIKSPGHSMTSVLDRNRVHESFKRLYDVESSRPKTKFQRGNTIVCAIGPTSVTDSINEATNNARK
jgi:hypothetical protein